MIAWSQFDDIRALDRRVVFLQQQINALSERRS